MLATDFGNWTQGGPLNLVRAKVSVRQRQLKGTWGMGRIRAAPTIAALLSVLALGGCGDTFLPSYGPRSIDVRTHSTEPDALPYATVRLTPEVVDILASHDPRLANVFDDRRPPPTLRFGVGDVVTVSIFEAAAGGLFIPIEAGVRPGNFIALPNQRVDNRGNITVPYAGSIRAAGRTPTEVQDSIVAALKNRAIEPQAVVALAEQRTSLISVLGDVNLSTRFPASAEGERVLDAITRAGGPKSQGFDEWVMLERGGRRATAPFGALVYEPSNNVWVHPNDTIYLYREPQTFVAFGAFAGGAAGAVSVTVGGGAGATAGQGLYNFDAWRLSLAEAIAKASGLNDAAADPASVFLYRGETREVAQLFGVDCSPFSGPIIPIVYAANLHDPTGYFLATKMQMRNKDVLYISNSGSVETAKLMTYFRLVVATVNDPILAATNGLLLRNTINGVGQNTPIITTAVPSDIRLKRDIVLLDRLPNGIGLYRYRYIWSEQVYVGVMAQEVAAIVPDAVVRGTDGFLRVDYARLGIRLLTWDDWAAKPRREAAVASTGAALQAPRALSPDLLLAD
jgi:polysaccharide biosynthesis/export protein